MERIANLRPNTFINEKNPVHIALSETHYMKLKNVITLLLVSFFWNAMAQDQGARQYGDQISEESLRENLTILASDALEGRETGKRGQKMAAAFIKAYFEELGLSGPVNGDY